MDDEQIELIWVCNVRGRAYLNPESRLEYFCIGIANGKAFLKRDHREANCGYYVKLDREAVL